MKKGIEWLKEEIVDYFTIEGNGFDVDGYEILDLINQLDEPEVLSQEWIRNNQERKGVHFFVNVTKLQNLLVPKQEITFYQVHDKLREKSILSEKSFDYYWNCINDNIEIDEPGNLIVPKQELPVIPKFVADWVVRYREKYDLYLALRLLENNTFVWGEIYEWYRMNTRKFVNAYLTGEYEVEEPLYHALIKGHEVSSSCDIYWNCDKSDCGVFVSRLHPLDDNFITEMSKEAWNELGIDDSNADFVKVDEELN